ncbi:MAG: hypothetical protein MJ232_05900 [archaeon]|nr:hypothetical protein [archaeon]
MAKQNINIKRTDKMNKILDLEKKYYEKLKEIINSQEFINDLLLIEKEIREKYDKYEKVWKIKNKIKIPAERLVRHHIYTKLHDEIKGIFPSPISSDFGVKMEDCILCVDIKTLDTDGNKIDINSTSVEANQLSFDNKNHKYVKTFSNLDPIDHYSRLDVLTYVIKIIYTDNKTSFKLSRETSPTLVLTCIPNGQLSELFDYDIIQNFKTYDYYDENDKQSLKEIEIPSQYSNRKDEYTETYCLDTLMCSKVEIELNSGKKKDAYFDAANGVIWWETQCNNKPMIRAVKSGSTARIYNDILKERYDSKNEKWIGYEEFKVKEIMN